MNYYHGTSSSHWNPLENYGYLFLTASIEHAIHHGKERALEGGGTPLLVVVDDDSIGDDFQRLPDNDCHELDGYTSWQESLREKGSFIVRGNTASLTVVEKKIESES